MMRNESDLSVLPSKNSTAVDLSAGKFGWILCRMNIHLLTNIIYFLILYYPPLKLIRFPFQFFIRIKFSVVPAANLYFPIYPH